MSDLTRHIIDRTPEGWKSQPLWSLFRRQKMTGYPNEELLSVYRDYGVIPKSSRDDNYNKESEDLSGYQLVTEGSLVTNKMKAWQGSIAISRHRGIVSPAYYVYEPLSAECDRFLHYLLRSHPYIALYGRISKGIRVNQWDLEHDALRVIPVMLPDLETQNIIADFLDHETARIDDFIDKKNQQLSLLKKRDNASVTGQLGFQQSSKHSFKDTNIPWMPEIPSNWAIERAKYLYRNVVRPPLFEDRIITAFRDGEVTLRENRRATGYTFAVKEVGYQHIKKGDLVIHTMDAFAGAIGVSDSDGKATGEYAVCEPISENVNNHYYAQLLRYMAEQNYIYVLCPSVRERAPRFRFSKFSPIFLPVPPREEQDKIADFLKLTERARRKIQSSLLLLKELRASLITAAVTGQVDAATWGKRGDSNRRIYQIEEEMAQREATG